MVIDLKYGLIGEKLGHSFSAEIHGRIGRYDRPESGGYDYCLAEISSGELDSFIRSRDFLGINVTIPYKQDVIPYLDEIDETAEKIGAVNTIVNRGGKLFGYNTDFGGMRSLIRKNNFELRGKKVLILGSGGTSKTAYAVARSLEASEIICVSRSGRNGAVTYDEMYSVHSDAEIIINTTPCGMFPNTEGIPVNLECFSKLSGVVDVIFNPLATKLVRRARELGIPACGGLYMLVVQAVLAYGHFFGREYNSALADRIYSELFSEKQNIVLIGMPGCGKTTIGKLIAQSCGKTFVDTDSMITGKTGMTVNDIFKKYGENEFRKLESEAVREASEKVGQVIATGGGAVLRSENVDALRMNGRIYFLDRPVDMLVPTQDRPLACSAEAIRKRYEERLPIYLSAADEVVSMTEDALQNAKSIENRHFMLC